MLCLGLKPGAAGWKAQTNQLSNGDTSGQVSADTRFSRQQLPQKIDNNRSDNVLDNMLLGVDKIKRGLCVIISKSS